MRHLAIRTLAAVAFTMPALPAFAQNRPVEIGVGGGGMASWLGGVPGAHVSVTFPIDERWSIEPIVAAGWQQDEDRRLALYGAQARFRLDRASRGDTETFLTLGAVGLYERETYPEYRYTYPDGRTYVQRGETHTTFAPPMLTVVGIGVQQYVSAHLAFRADVQAVTLLVIPGGLRAAAGVSIPIGRFTRPTRAHASTGRDTSFAARRRDRNTPPSETRAAADDRAVGESRSGTDR